MTRCNISVLLLSILFSLTGTAQAQPAYPTDYFRNPLGIPILLAGNFGECRPGHFHSGIDIKTGGRENLPVYAAADGYVSRIKMEPGGFGHGLYVTHPNGYTTLYAHLNDFVPALQQYVRQQQYAAESWTVDLKLSPDQFPVRQGEQIAFSGNTGGSTAPHLHFEIRDSRTEHPLNPQQFGLPVKDSRPPVPTKLAIYNRDQRIYKDSPVLMRLVKKGSSYTTISDTLAVYDTNGFGLEVNDYMDGSDNTLAFYTVEWLVDDVPQGRIRLDDIGYDETRYLHAYADYKTRQQRNTWIQCLFRLPGNNLGHIYEGLNRDAGHIIMPDNDVHRLSIILTDDAGNTTEIRQLIRRGRTQPLAGCDAVWPQSGYAWQGTNLAYTLDNKVLYDDMCIVKKPYREDAAGFSPRQQVGMAWVPAHHAFDLRIRPNKVIPFALRNKMALRYSDGKSESGRAATAQDKGWYSASVRSFGDYWLVADTTAPVIQPVVPWKDDQSRTARITFKIADALTGIGSVRAELDGQWLLLEQHEQFWFYEMDAYCPKGKHQLSVTATDENGNIARRIFSFTR